MFVYADNLALSKVLMSKKNPSGKYSLNGQEVSYDALNDTLQKNLALIAGSPQLYRENKNTLFALIEQTLNEVMPKNVLETYGMFADVQTVPQGDTIVFTRKIGDMRAKQFITRVALAGRYEAFELAEEKFEIKTTAYGGAARIGIEEFLDGRVQWQDYLSIINEGMSEAVYKEIAKALIAAIAMFPATNRVAYNGFNETQFDRLLATIAVYGSPVIYCTLEAAMTLIPNQQWVSENMKDERWARGYFTSYKGHPVVVLPQSFTDETNAAKVIHPSYIYVFPVNNQKPVKVVFEGQTLVKEFENRDWSTELQTYQKFGIGLLTTNNLAVFRNTDLGFDNVPFNYNTNYFTKGDATGINPAPTPGG
jgi:hypothetical protein